MMFKSGSINPMLRFGARLVQYGGRLMMFKKTF